MANIGLMIFGLLFGIGILKLRQLATEARRQSAILYEIGVALKADLPETMRPRGGFVAELKRGLTGR